MGVKNVKPAQDAFTYLRKGQKECEKAHLKAVEVLKSFGLYYHTLQDALSTYATREKFRSYIEIARQHWGSLEISEALERLGCTDEFPLTKEFLQKSIKTQHC